MSERIHPTNTEPDTSGPILDKIAFGRRWGFQKRTVNKWLAEGMPHLRIGERRVRIVVAEADAWLRDRYSVRRRSGRPQTRNRTRKV